MFVRLLFISLLFMANLFANDSLRVVYNSGTPPFKFKDSNNQANGMLIDIWKLWAKKNNINITFVAAHWTETLEMIKDGRADIHAGVYYTNERDDYLDYTSRALYNNKKYFFYHKSLGEVLTIDALKPYVISIDNGYPETFMKESYPQFSYKTFESADDANNDFFLGHSKVTLASLSTFFYYLKTHGYDEKAYYYNETTFAYTKQYFGAVKQGNKKLLKQIDDGFKKITNDELRLIELEWTKELNLDRINNNRDKFILTLRENEYLSEKKEIKMCVDPSWQPFESIKNKLHTGMVADIIKYYESLLGYPIKLIQTSSWTHTLELAKEKKCDILSAAAATQTRKEYLNFTQPYLIFPEVIVTRGNEPFINNIEDILHQKIGVVRNSAIYDLLKIKYPNINLVETLSVEEGLYKVSSGELYGFVNTTAALSHSISTHGMTHLKIAGKVGIDYYLRIGVRNDDFTLLNIFNQLIHHGDKEKINEIKEKWLTVKVEESIDYTMVYKGLFAFVVLLAIMIYWNRKLSKEIEERKIVQRKLDKFMQVIEQSKNSIMITNTKGIIEYVNPYCLKETGYEKTELIGAKPSILKSGEQPDVLYKELWKSISKGKAWYGEFSNKRKNNESFWESAVIAPIYDNNEIKYYVSIKENITEKKKVQAELQKAQEEAMLANRAKSDFLAKMSHEIRTPMNAVLGMLYLLEKTALSTTQDNYIKKAHGAANSLLGVINDILDFSKIEANKLEIKNSDFNLHELINDTLSVMSVKAQENELELLTYYDNNLPLLIESDKLRVSQILNNLISNAIKFTHQGEVLVSTKLVHQYHDEAVIMFCIKDSGIGISNENQNKLFQEFSQVDDSATRSFHGTGLGLAISKKLTELLNGEIWVEDSQEGVGTTICFTIKVKFVGDELYETFTFPTSVSNLQVLVVDDNELAANVLSEMLLSFDYKVDVVHNGFEAIQAVENSNYDLVFLDYKMPVINGIETFCKYKDSLKSKTPKTLMVTAYSQELVEQEVEKYGILGYITKPISPSTLYDTIMESLSQQHCIKTRHIIEEKPFEKFDGLNILLVEDNKINQEVAVSILESSGLKVSIANDGVEALEKIKTKEYSAILMDIQMPKMDGLEATKLIREMNGRYYTEVPIIALSANALVGDREKSLNAGMNEHITKPIDPRKLFEVLSEFIGGVQPLTIELEDESYEFIQYLDQKVLNTPVAMDRMSKNEKAYLKILEQFRNNYKNVFEEVHQLIQANNIDALGNKIHELKGIAGNISADKLFSTLSDLNKLLQEKVLPPLRLFESCEQSLDEVMIEIQKLNHNDNVDGKGFEHQKVIELFEEIKKNINIDIVKSEDALEKLLPYLQESHQSLALELTTSFNDFDTDNVLTLIEKFIKELPHDA